jgi:hypothetical protein
MQERNVLRKVHGYVTEQGVWRIRNSQEQLSDEAEYIEGGLVQLGYVIKMDQRGVDQKLLESKLEERRNG